ncbi:M28 family peptidase [Sphingomonas sp. MMS24-J13]|uniref:M28 family peptidase n=1 Tax=Sphingomonas sp. MMS24-J13 TaxID=3238686 RepID=UPI00384D6739
MTLAAIVLALLQVPLDADTAAWWHTTGELSNDAMEGRDTGSPGYDRAAALVAKKWTAAGLKPIGDNGGWFQQIPFEEIAVTQAAITANGKRLAFLSDITVTASSVGPTFDAPIAYRGYCRPDQIGDVRGKLVICHGSRRDDMPSAADRVNAAAQAGAAGIATIADPGFTIEPPRWPAAYAREVWIAGSPPAKPPIATFSLNADALDTLIAGSGQDAAALIRAGSEGGPLPAFDVPGRMRARFTITRRTLTSANVVALLPGTDPALADEPIVLTAHLDGYGHGQPVKGDGLYNGTLDDAAYVALLTQLAVHRAGKGYRHPIIFAALTGEEKGLWGSRWLVAHRPAGHAHFAADINLDQLRPIFPLALMTVHGLEDSTLGGDARAVANKLGIQVQLDPEPARNLIQRADHWNFLRAGIPAVNFVFGYKPGTPSEAIYRRWYREGYHRPQDDLKQAIDWKAAADFNRFFYALVDRVADTDGSPVWAPSSPYRPKP